MTFPAGWGPLEIELHCFREGLTEKEGGLGKAEHFRNVVRILYPKEIKGRPNPCHFEFHPLADKMTEEACANRYLAIAGGGSLGKTEWAAMWAIVNFLAKPKETLILVVSTSLKDSRERIWGAIEKYWLGRPGLPGKLVSSSGRIRYDLGNMTKDAADNCGITLIAGDSSKAKEAAKNIIGKKAARIILIADEHPELSEAINEAALGNMSTTGWEWNQFIGLGNPKSHYDAFGKFCEPAAGWAHVHAEMEEWATKYGKCIRLDALKSPNWLAGRNLYKYLVKVEDIEGAKKTYGENSPTYWRMFRGFWCPVGSEHTVFSEADIIKFGGSEPVIWKSEPTDVAALDPAFTSGGDESILYFGKWGVEAHTEQNVLLLADWVSLKENVTDTETPRNFQIAYQFKEQCQRRGIVPENAAIDATNIPFADIVAHVWSPRVYRVNFGGRATERPVSEFSPEPACEKYVNRVTEIWYSGMELLKHRQLRGIGPELARELCSRLVDTTKASSGNLRMLVESKRDMKARSGRSPDKADAAMVLVDLIRERFGSGTPRFKDGDGKTRGQRWRELARRLDTCGPAHLAGWN